MKNPHRTILGIGVAGVVAAAAIAPANAAHWRGSAAAAAAAGFVGGLALGSAVTAPYYGGGYYPDYGVGYYPAPAVGYGYAYPGAYGYSGGDRLHNAVGNW